MYYAAINAYSTETSIGFTNTWGVLGFMSKVNRDNYVRNCNKLATKKILAKEVGKYGGKIGEIEAQETVKAMNHAINEAAEEYWSNQVV